MNEDKSKTTKQAADSENPGSAVILRPKYPLSRTKTASNASQKSFPNSKSAPEKPRAATHGPEAKPKKPARTIKVTYPHSSAKASASASSQATDSKSSPHQTDNTSKTTKAKTKKAKKNMKLPIFRKIHLKPSHIVSIVLVAILAIFFGRVALWEHSYFDRMEGSDRDTPAGDGTSGVIYDGGEDVDETEYSEDYIANYVVAPNMPRYFSIPSLGIINAPVSEVGLLANGAIDVPRNINMIGWYGGSSLPGTNGTALLDAHGGDLGNGIFRTLPRIQIGADINIEMGDGRLYTYKVVDTATRPLDGANNADQYMPTALTSPQPNIGSITLITCTGEWSQMRQTYLDRFFVRATLQASA